MKHYIYVLLTFMAFSSVLKAQNADSLTTSSAIVGMPDEALSVAATYTKSMGDSAYMNNDYKTAIEAYESLLRQGEAAEIYYNLGNSYYKEKELGRAILNYERALLLKPGDSDARTNLDIARSKTIDKVNPTPEIFFVTWFRALINTLSVNAWAVWGIVLFVCALAGIACYAFLSQTLHRKLGFISALASFALCVLCNVFAWTQANKLDNRDSAIVLSPSVVVRSTPSENGTSLFVIHEGRKVLIKDNSMKDWKEIELEDGNVGWIPINAIELI